MLDILDFMHESQAALQDVRGMCERALSEASQYLIILDPVYGDQELIRWVAVERAKLSRG